MADSNQVPWGKVNKGTIHKGVNGLHRNRGISAAPAAKSKEHSSYPWAWRDDKKQREKQRRGGRKGVAEEGKEETER